MLRLLQWTALGMACMCANSLQAQITVPRTISAEIDRYATLEEQLTNRLKATREDQQNYIRLVVKKVRKGRLEARLVVAIERYALRRNPHYPFPFFERALRFEANKRGVPLPDLQQVASTKAAPRPVK